MHSDEYRNLAKRCKENRFSYNEIMLKLGISRKYAINLCKYKKKIIKMKTDPKNKITKNDHVKIKREI